MEFTPQNIFINVNASNQEEVFHFLASQAHALQIINDESAFVEALKNREAETTTGFGNHVAIPHARSNCINHVGVIVCRLNQGVEWNALDGEPVSLCICLMTPETSSDDHLKLLSKFARKLIHEDFIDELKKGNKQELYKTIQNVIG